MRDMNARKNTKTPTRNHVFRLPCCGGQDVVLSVPFLGDAEHNLPAHCPDCGGGFRALVSTIYVGQMRSYVVTWIGTGTVR